MLLRGNGIQYTDSALRMPNNTYIIKIHFLIEYVFILAYTTLDRVFSVSA